MLRTIIWFIYFGLYLIFTLPTLYRVGKLTKKNNISERDSLVNDTVHKWAQTLVKFSGAQIKVSGEENILQQGPVLFVVNHQSNFDIPILLGFIKKPKAFIAKEELLKIPIIKSWMFYLNCVFITRNNAREALKAINKGIEVLQNGYSLVVFPEGTRSNDGSLGDFKPGSLKLATKSGVPIVPVTIKGSHRIMAKGSFLIRPCNIEVIISPTISQDIVKTKDAKELAEELREIIVGNL